MKTIIGALVLLSLAAGPAFADAPPIHRGPWPIYNGFNHQPRQQDLPPAVLRDEGHIAPSQRDFDQSLQICRPC
jgi:hypothetical protein